MFERLPLNSPSHERGEHRVRREAVNIFFWVNQKHNSKLICGNFR